MNNSDIEAVVAKLKSAPVSKRLGERFYISEELFRIAVNNQAKEKEVKKYRLKKDTPTIKAGTIFQEVTSDYDKSRELARIMPLGGTTSPQWTIDDINNFDEWFEEVKEYKRWRSEKGERYWFIRPPLYIDSETELHSSFDDECWESGNYFKTKEEAELYKRKLVANQKLIDTAKKAWFEFDGSEGPDWDDLEQCKFEIYLDRNTGELYIMKIEYTQRNILPPFPTQKSCQSYIDSHQYDLKLLFGAE